MLSDIGLFKGIMTKMGWLDQNQRIITQNVANADTPGYRPYTLKDMDFKSVLGASIGPANGAGDMAGGAPAQVRPVSLAVTDPAHLSAMQGGGAESGTKQKSVYEASPDGNAVVLEEQLFKANQNSINYQIATDLYRRNVGMIRLVLQSGTR
ncbi:MAG: flagellar basal body rod protein FlgB [Rhodospirillales bacterium]|nr:flagellar basal body rod protein FlgB [Alphaproteobacteria bacterium]MCB9987155.1 flagellar basal body rod protein FlgB [Rhodospirillales bacterium]USO08088.1 MAG: flagellar basal body rod protein FlgB [Rhodospirillales bacterium]